MINNEEYFNDLYIEFDIILDTNIFQEYLHYEERKKQIMSKIIQTRRDTEKHITMKWQFEDVPSELEIIEESLLLVEAKRESLWIEYRSIKNPLGNNT
jgi:hypothetical protein